jgi:hypothetical protein
VILHHSEPAGDSYLVVDGEAVYRFARGTVSAPVPPTPAVVPADPPGNRGERLLRAVLAASRSTARLP